MVTEINPSGELDLMPPTNFVAIRPEQSCCGRYAFGSWDILVTTHTTKTIRVWVKTKWVYQSTNMETTDYYDVGPGENVNLGCDFLRPDLGPLQEFDRSIVRAIY